MNLARWLYPFGAALLIACADGGPITEIVTPITPDTGGVIKDTTGGAPRVRPVYLVDPPTGKLPYPQHAPHFTRAEYEEMMRVLYVANNFALYQAAPNDRESAYLHNGYDLVLPNGTPLYTVADGYVRYIGGNVEFYKLLYIEDADQPGTGWAYVHVDDFEVNLGEFVPKGTRIARVRFQGLEHLHLERIVGTPGFPGWSMTSIVRENPEPYFEYPDTEPPVFQGGIHYFRNESDEQFARPATGPPIVHGDVDVAVGIRDPGEHGRSKTFTFADGRQAPTRIEYSIAPLGGNAPRVVAFDLSMLRYRRAANGQDWPFVNALYKFYEAVLPNRSANQIFTPFYVITNKPPGDRPFVVRPEDSLPSWRTTELPNGDYVVTIWAYDARDNMAVISDTVRVAN